eukprot:TRINITY_DN1969_c0_g1_i1.p2 TRINITY_DN1969_c0_g1~~TRINITY_DN1969_c0_g1_i1.p2  ORF type:complete len:405 (+),score=151.61 TRINITY_DN1969_c0_g1_i1:87-1301(+)
MLNMALRRAAGAQRRWGHKFSFYDKTVEEYACQTPLHVKPAYAMEFADTLTEQSLLTYSQYLHKELPVRLARTIRDFQALPYIVGVNPHVEKIYAELSVTFNLVVAHPVPATQTAHESWVRLVQERLRVHADLISDISKGIKEVRLLPHSSRVDFQYLDGFLDRALTQRTGRRVLGELLLAFHHQLTTGQRRPHQKGIFSQVRPKDVVHHCMDQVLYLASSHYDREVEYEIVGDTHAELLCIASHMEYILFELCKNAVRATLDHHPKGRVPKIIFRICKGQDVSVVISDKGGGIPVVSGEEAKKVGGPGSYGYSTARPSHFDNELYNVNYPTTQDQSTQLQFAGFGFGLALSRVYSRYNGGTLSYQSLPGYGTDMYLTFPNASSLSDWEKKYRVGTFEDHVRDL